MGSVSGGSCPPCLDASSALATRELDGDASPALVLHPGSELPSVSAALHADAGADAGAETAMTPGGKTPKVVLAIDVEGARALRVCDRPGKDSPV
jgi:hypothetical protein